MQMRHRDPGYVRRLVSNVVSQIGGRLFLSVARFGIALLIIRHQGFQRFGEYAVIVSLSMVAEWVVDFGMNDIVVRAIAQKPGRRREMMQALAANKWIQAFIGCLFLAGTLLAMQYPADVARAGATTMLGVLCSAGILVYRAAFRERMEMARDVLAEVISIAALLPLVWLIVKYNLGLQTLIWAYISSRGMHLIAAVTLGRRSGLYNPLRATAAAMREVAGTALPLGITGLIICLYDVLDPLLLSKMPGQFHSAGRFTGAMRLVAPSIIVAQAIAFTIYPLLCSYWKYDRAAFRRTLQRCLDVAVLTSGVVLCLFQAGAGPILGLLGQAGRESDLVLRLLVGVICIRSLMTIIAPVVIIAEGVRHTIWLTLLGLGLKTLLLLLLVPSCGATGAALGYLLSECLGSLLPVAIVCRRLTGFHLNWIILAKVLGASAVALAVVYAMRLSDTVPGCFLAVLIFATLAVASGALHLAELRELMRAVSTRIPPATPRPLHVPD